MTVYIKGKLSKGDKLVFESNEKYIGSHMVNIPLKECIKHDAFLHYANSGESEHIDNLFNNGIVQIEAVVYNTTKEMLVSTMEGLISNDLDFSEDVTAAYLENAATDMTYIRRIKFKGKLDINKLTVNDVNVIDTISAGLVGEYLKAEITII